MLEEVRGRMMEEIEHSIEKSVVFAEEKTADF